jgi:hypothetical protein
MAYDVEGEYVDFTDQTISSGTHFASDRFGVDSTSTTALIEGGEFDGRWLNYGDIDYTGGDFNAVEVTKFEPDGTPYQAIQGGFYFRGDSTAESTVSGGDFTGLVYTELGGGMRPWFNGEGDPSDSSEHTVHIRGGSFAPGQIMYGMFNSTTYIYGTDFTVETLEVAAVGIPQFPSYLPPSVEQGAAKITCTLEDGTYFETEWRFWEARNDPTQERFLNFGTIFEVEWRYEERYDKDYENFDGWGWFPTVDGEGNNTPYFAMGETYDGPDDDYWQGPLVLVDVSDQEVPIPEPATTALLGLAALGGIAGARRRK